MEQHKQQIPYFVLKKSECIHRINIFTNGTAKPFSIFCAFQTSDNINMMLLWLRQGKETLHVRTQFYCPLGHSVLLRFAFSWLLLIPWQKHTDTLLLNQAWKSNETLEQQHAKWVRNGKNQAVAVLQSKCLFITGHTSCYICMASVWGRSTEVTLPFSIFILEDCLHHSTLSAPRCNSDKGLTPGKACQTHFTQLLT